MESKLEKEVRFLKIYAVIATLVCGVLVLSAFTLQKRNQNFDEITAHRLNIVEQDGKPRFIIHNSTSSPDWVVKGKTYPGRVKDVARFLFYDQEGDEAGALAFNGKHEPDGKRWAGAGLYFDKIDGDQLLDLIYEDYPNGETRAGLQVRDYPPSVPTRAETMQPRLLPPGPERDAAQARIDAVIKRAGGYNQKRMFVGRETNGDAIIRLADAQGRMRLRLVVDAAGVARIEFLDADGKITKQIDGTSAK